MNNFSTWLLKPAELTLKGDNKKSFEGTLKSNIQRLLAKIDSHIKIRFTSGRYYIQAPQEKSELIEDALSRLIGISGWAKTLICEKIKEDVLAACVEEGKKIARQGIKTFKIDARRTDKSFPLSSYELCCEAGNAVTNAICDLKVDIHNPQDIIRIEIREKAFVYSGEHKGLGGLPVGTAGKGLLLLSGGIDSPVAGFLMACRGMSIDAIHFHAYPYTSQEAKQKAIQIAGITGSYCMGIHLYIINFTKVQMRIKERSPQAWTTVLLRMAMMEAAEKAANKIKCKCLITGESLSQVASQTIENLSCTQSRIKLPVIRPLIGFDKQSIIKEAQRIGTYDISIQPFDDCCMLFSPQHPVLHGNPQEANKLYEALDLEELINEALGEYEMVK
ncbi:MAG: tRNA 4-thiouridine(8) synthase ThiI [Treponema sp.]|nr:tRNA 4-thiouridine(8) synthase ThiI [Treponema sp.]MCL2250929.1 tRNA 4-thiouridine(8) synthase ThiI [Treponema sp.]